MPTIAMYGSLALLAFALYVVHVILGEIAHKRRARSWGCKSAFLRKSRLPLGLDILQRTADASKKQVLQNDDLELHNELGRPSTWRQSVLCYGHYVTVDPENIKAVLATQFKDFELGNLARAQYADLMGYGIFTSDGKEWEHSRALLRPQFSRGQVSDLSLEERHVQNLLKRLKVDAGADVWSEEVDLAPLFFNLTLDTATEFLFGVSVLSQIGEEYASAPPANDWSNFGRCFDAAHFTTVSRARLMDLYWLYNPKSFRANCRAVHKCVDHFVDLALRGSHEKLAMDDGGAEKHYTFLQELVKLTQDPLELRGNLLHILMAGRDTTAGLLGWIFYLLARHPSVYEKLRQTILADFGPFSSDTDRITFESLKACHYLQHVISETLRLYSVVPESMRTAVRDTKLPRGGGTDGKSPIYVRRGETVIYNMNIMHRREDLWGEDAHEFKPERWDHRRQGWDYLPFSGGPRICLGQQFALTEAGYVVVRMLQKFDRLDNLDQHEEPRHRFMSTTSPVEVSVRLRQATTH